MLDMRSVLHTHTRVENTIHLYFLWEMLRQLPIGNCALNEPQPCKRRIPADFSSSLYNEHSFRFVFVNWRDIEILDCNGILFLLNGKAPT